jgi:DeoR/GlpR family transcriptional regulator of sugar metabolism
MLTSQRKSLILDMLRREGQVVAKRAAEEFALSEDTIRRDLREMASEGLLRRVHGGAMPLAPDLPDFSARRSVSSDAKARLGAAATAMVKPGQTIFLDGGTSTAEIACALPRDFAFTVATHSPTIAAELEHHPTAEVILIGGKLYKHSMVATGAVAMSQIALMRPDIFFLGVTAAHAVRGLSTGDFEEAAIKRHIASCAAETITLVTAEKLDAVSPHMIMPASELSCMIVQTGIEEERLAAYRAMGVSLVEA